MLTLLFVLRWGGGEGPPFTGEDSRSAHQSPTVRLRGVGGWGFPSGGAWQGDYRLPFVSRAERSLEGLLLRRGSLDLHIDFSPTLLPPPRPGHGPHQWSWEGGEEAGRSRAEAAAAAAARRGRGGAAPPPLSPNRVTGGAARVSLRAEKYGRNSQDRSRPPLTRAARARRQRSSRPFHPGDAPPRPGPTAPAPGPALTTRPGPAGLARRGGRRPLRARDLRARRRPPPRPPAPHPRRWVWRSRSCYPETEGRKTAAAARPSRRGAATAGNKGDKAASAGPGFAPSPPRPPGRPPPARRPGQAGSSRESQARGPEPPGTPHSSPPGSALAEGGGLHPSFEGSGGAAAAGCTTAVARATRTAAGGG